MLSPDCCLEDKLSVLSQVSGVVIFGDYLYRIMEKIGLISLIFNLKTKECGTRAFVGSLFKAC